MLHGFRQIPNIRVLPIHSPPKIDKARVCCFANAVAAVSATAVMAATSY